MRGGKKATTTGPEKEVRVESQRKEIIKISKISKIIRLFPLVKIEVI